MAPESRKRLQIPVVMSIDLILSDVYREIAKQRLPQRIGTFYQVGSWPSWWWLPDSNQKTELTSARRYRLPLREY
jgi:myo-inositol catabolism protein IolC